eukprot:g25752.t1
MFPVYCPLLLRCAKPCVAIGSCVVTQDPNVFPRCIDVSCLLTPSATVCQSLTSTNTNNQSALSVFLFRVTASWTKLLLLRAVSSLHLLSEIYASGIDGYRFNHVGAADSQRSIDVHVSDHFPSLGSFLFWSSTAIIRVCLLQVIVIIYYHIAKLPRLFFVKSSKKKQHWPLNCGAVQTHFFFFKEAFPFFRTDKWCEFTPWEMNDSCYYRSNITGLGSAGCLPPEILMFRVSVEYACWLSPTRTPDVSCSIFLCAPLLC